MTAKLATKFNQSGYCFSFAAAGTSMHFARILDTAIIAVSVFIALVGLLLA